MGHPRFAAISNPIKVVLPVIFLIILGAFCAFFYFMNSALNQLQETAEERLDTLGETATVKSTKALDNLGELMIKQKAEAVAKQVQTFLMKSQPTSIEDLQKNKNFNLIAVQQVGQTGYTAINEYDTFINRFHKKAAIVNMDLNILKEKLPDFYQIMLKSNPETPVGGYYDWQEPDGTIRKKYMWITPVGSNNSNLNLAVAATTYIDEFSNPVKELNIEMEHVISSAMSDLSDSSTNIRKSAITTVLIIIILTGLVFCWVYYLANRYLEVIRQKSDELGVAYLDLQESEETFRMISESAQDAIIMIDEHGTINFWNNSAVNILGWQESEAIGNDFIQLILPIRYKQILDKKLFDFHDNSQASVRGKIIELQALASDGREIAVELSVAAVSIKEHWHGIIILRDVSERDKITAEKARLEVQLQQSQKLEAIGQLAAGIAHEINTPTQYVKDNVEFLASSFTDLNDLLTKYNELLNEAQGIVKQDLVDNITSEIEDIDLDFLQEEIPHALKQTQSGLLSISKIVKVMKDFSHPGNKSKEPLDLNESIQTAIDVSANEWKYVTKLTTDLDKSLPLVPCIRGEINQVILNLIINAAHAISQKDEDDSLQKNLINIATRVKGKHAEITVTDSGAGIPEEIQEKIFEPFFTTKEVGKGSGQGLTISYSTIVDKHQGTIEVTSEAGKGTCFTVTLPLAE